MTKKIGPSFVAELNAAGLSSLPFSFSEDGEFNFDPRMDAEKVDAVLVLYAEHDPSKVSIPQQAIEALQRGIRISCAGAPGVDGTYSIDALSQVDIIAIETGLKAGDGFPGGVDTLRYPDEAGALHPFTQDRFKAFAAAVRSYVYALRAAAGGSLDSLPSTDHSIS